MLQVKKSILKFSVLVFSLIITSCGNISSEDLNSEIIRTNYSVNFNEDEKQTTVSGEFTVGNGFTYVSLDGESKLIIDSAYAKMKRTLVGQIYYAHKISGLRNAEIDLDYIDSKSVHYRNKIKLPSKFTHNTVSVLNVGQDLEINYNILDSQDSLNEVSVSIYSENEVQSFNMNEENIKGQITIKNEELQIFKDQNVSVKICRSNTLNVDEHPGRGGYMSSKYCTKIFKMKIK